MKDLKEMTVDELRELIALAEERIRELTAGKVRCFFETHRDYDPRKHGHAYVAIVKGRGADGKIIREFLNNCQRVYDSKHKYYTARWEVDLPVGTKIEARLEEGSWKNERRSYYIITEEGPEEVDRKEVLGI